MNKKSEGLDNSQNVVVFPHAKSLLISFYSYGFSLSERRYYSQLMILKTLISLVSAHTLFLTRFSS